MRNIAGHAELCAINTATPGFQKLIERVIDAVARAGKARRIFGSHVCDWLVQTEDVLNDRGMMGDGIIEVPAIREHVEAG